VDFLYEHEGGSNLQESKIDSTDVNGATTGGNTSYSDGYGFALDGTLDGFNRPRNISDAPCRNCPVSGCKDFSEKAIQEFCHYRGYEEHDARLLVIMNRVLFHSSIINIKKVKGNDIQLEEIFVAMCESMLDIMDSNYSNNDSELVSLFYDIAIVVNDVRLNWVMMSVLAHAGFDVRIAPAGFGIKVVVHDIDITSGY